MGYIRNISWFFLKSYSIYSRMAVELGSRFVSGVIVSMH